MQTAGPRCRFPGNPAWRSDPETALRPREYFRVTPARDGIAMITAQINDRAIQKAFDALEASLTDISPALNDIGYFLVASTKERIRQGTSPDGSPFAPRSPATLDRYGKGRDGKGQGPLWLPASCGVRSHMPSARSLSKSFPRRTNRLWCSSVPRRAPSVCMRDRTSSGDGMPTASCGQHAGAPVPRHLGS